MIVFLLVSVFAAVSGGPATETYKDQYCTDPRTMAKHAAYTEWADAYSCTRHRCQPGGRNLAIYTVGCKRVEAPESAIECEEVVEDTNMQFPFCCTRLRCLVVVRGEVWTRVLGQPWETLPAAPWSHMYKMKKPPPAAGTFLPKTPDQGPIYELAVEGGNEASRADKVMRAEKVTTEAPDYNEAIPRANVPRASAPAPDIVIALSTSSDPKEKDSDGPSSSRHSRIHKEVPRTNNFFEEEREAERARDRDRDHTDTDGGDMDLETITPTEKPAPAETSSDERFYGNPNTYAVTPKATKPQHHQAVQSWTEIPQNQWNEHDPGIETDSNRDNPYNQQDFPPEQSEHKPEPEKQTNLQALVDAIGSRMRDIENVVQRMSEKVHTPAEEDTEKSRPQSEDESLTHKRTHKIEVKESGKTKRPGTDDHYKRFSVRNRGSKYLHSTDTTTDLPLFVEDTNMNGYFSDASNSVLRRSNGPKEPAQTYMAPVENRRKARIQTDTSEEKKKKKHQHKKKKGKHHKKHHAKKRFNRLSSTEIDKNVVSLEDSSATGST